MTTSWAPRHRRVSLTAGVLYVLTFVSIPTFALYDPVKSGSYGLGSRPTRPPSSGPCWKSSSP